MLDMGAAHTDISVYKDSRLEFYETLPIGGNHITNDIAMTLGISQEEAERLTDEYINKPGASDHNLGLAVDFNYVDNKFDDLEAFKWLKENAEDYGFILRYPKDKEEITKISYESWHWRYVGEEHAKKMNELNMCLEEYIEYLQNQE